MSEKPPSHEDIKQLIEFLDQSDAGKRSWAAEQLGVWNISEALIPLISLLSDENDEVRASATFAVGNIADKLWEIPENYYSGSSGAEIRAAHELIRETVIPKLSELLSDSYGEVRLWAIRGITAMTRGVNIIPELIKLLSDPEIEVRKLAISSFGMLNTTIDIPYLIGFLSDPDISIRKASIEVLSSKKVQEAIPYFISLLWHKNGEIRSAALSALKYVRAKELIQHIPQLLSDPDKNIRTAIIEFIEDLEISEAVPQLYKLLSDSDSDIRYLTATALGSLGDLQPLITLTIDQDFSTRYYAVQVLGEVGTLETLPILEELRHKDLDRTDGYSVANVAGEAIRNIKKKYKVR